MIELTVVTIVLILGAFAAGWLTNEWFNWKELTDFCKLYGEKLKR